MSLQDSRQLENVKVLLKAGSDGRGISEIEKVGTSGVVDTYDIILSDGTRIPFDVTNGSSIATIEKTATVGLVDTYTITLTNGDTFNFEVTNADGSTAETVGYDNTSSGLDATNVQDAIDEIDTGLDDKVNKSGDTMTGVLEIKPTTAGNTLVRVVKVHTSTTSDPSDVVIGNSTPDGTEGASHGRILLYGTSSFHTIIHAASTSATRSIGLPDKSGTLALTDDIQIYSVTKDTSSGTSITFKPSNYSRYAIHLFGNGNGSAYTGTIMIELSSSNYVRNEVPAFRNGTYTTLTATHNADDTVTVSGLPSWGYYTLLSRYPIS